MGLGPIMIIDVFRGNESSILLVWSIFVPAVVLSVGLLLLASLLSRHRWGDPVSWPGLIPLAWRLVMPLDAALVLRSLSYGVDQGRPLDQTLGELAQIYPRAHIASRLRQVSEQIADGNNSWDCLRRVGLINRGQWAVISAAERLGNLAWALRSQGEASLRRLTYRLHAVSSILFPLVLVALALAVGVIVVGFFQPLAEMVEMLHGQL